MFAALFIIFPLCNKIKSIISFVIALYNKLFQRRSIPKSLSSKLRKHLIQLTLAFLLFKTTLQTRQVHSDPHFSHQYTISPMIRVTNDARDILDRLAQKVSPVIRPGSRSEIQAVACIIH